MLKQLFFHIFWLSILAFNGYSQSITVSGYVKEVGTGEILSGATIITSDKIGVSSNNQGFFSLRIPLGENRLICSFVGFESAYLEYNFIHDTIIQFDLHPISTELEEVVIKHDNSNSAFLTGKIGSNRISSLEIKNQPVLLGESDLMKSLQLLPGIQSGNEGSSGIYVRGGSPDQNLIQLDGVPVYNAYHLFGFFSVFNTDAIRDVNIMKGGIPARYGGRLSSVLEITMKEGSLNDFKGDVTLGLIASKFVVEGPITKGKGSFLITGRRTNLDFLSKQINKFFVGVKGGDNNTFYFYDLNAKINYIFSKRSRIFLSFYNGRDKSIASSENSQENFIYNYSFLNKRKTDINWGNLTSSARYHLIISPRIFANLIAYSSNYDYISRENSYTSLTSQGVKNEKEISREYVSNVNDLGFGLGLDYLVTSSIRIKMGGNYILHSFKPGIESFKVDDLYPELNVDTLFGSKHFSKELSTYIETEAQLWHRLEINLGVNYCNYFLSDTTFFSLEPRLSLSMKISDNSSIKASYSRLSQNIHLLSNTTLGLPTDLWLPVTKRVLPQKGDIYSIGFFTILTTSYHISLEGFYKNSSNIIAYKEGANYFTGSLNWEDKVTSGIGWSYGGELLAKKVSGKINGSVAYTLSKTQRKFSDLNNGKIFPFKYDRRHDFSINANYNYSARISFGATWVYGTGTAVTVPNQVSFTELFYEGQGVFNNLYHITEEINGVRMPAYHRLDVGINFYKKFKKANRTLSVGIYNLYNRSNPYYLYMYFAPEGPEVKQKSLFPILPYISYSLKF